jgi:cytochrome b6-f complex iron-sulfur subunit
MADAKAAKGLLGREIPDQDTTLWSRRDIFSLAGWAGFGGVVGASLLAFTRFMFPRILFEPPAVFVADKPENFVPGVVDERWKKSQRVWIVRKEDGSLYALLAICTHLGCTPNWFASENKFKCPCHGSGFKRDGTNFEGPAPRPLDRIKLALTSDGTLQVDKSAIFRMVQGNPEAQYPHSILRV